MSGDDEFRANDALACAAPELLETLSELLDCVELENTDGVGEDRIEAAIRAGRAALAKALGEGL